MSKLFKKIASIAIVGVMATSLAMSVGAVTNASCPPHLTTKIYTGTNYTAPQYTHEYVYEIRDGQPIKRTCTVYEIESAYVYKCQKCAAITGTGTERRIVHSQCGA